MLLADYYPVFVQVGLALFFAVAIIAVSQLLGQRAPRNPIKDRAYECGMPAEGRAGARFSVKFYLTAMLFILFDIEIVFLIPWALVYRDFLGAGLPILWPVLFFILVMVLGLAYEMRKGALRWER